VAHVIKRLHNWIGLNGVDETENARALRWAHYLEIPAIAFALCIIVLWHMETRHSIAPLYGRILDSSVWVYFVAETIWLTYLVDNRPRYLRNNWLNLLIIVLGVPILAGYYSYATGLRSLRLFIFVSLLLPMSATLRKILARNHLGLTLLVSALVVFISGYIIASIDPSIKSPADGIWWAIVTVTGVGYGDIVPTSLEGRLFATMLILGGVTLFSVVTANLSVFFISRAEAIGDIEPSQQHIENIDRRLQLIEQHLGQISLAVEKAYASQANLELQESCPNR
jgi:voltage-gated potassium channel